MHSDTGHCYCYCVRHWDNEENTNWFAAVGQTSGNGNSSGFLRPKYLSTSPFYFSKHCVLLAKTVSFFCCAFLVLPFCPFLGWHNKKNLWKRFAGRVFFEKETLLFSPSFLGFFQTRKWKVLLFSNRSSSTPLNGGGVQNRIFWDSRLTLEERSVTASGFSWRLSSKSTKYRSTLVIARPSIFHFPLNPFWTPPLKGWG